MREDLYDWLREAQEGDLRPQANPNAAVNLKGFPEDREGLMSVLIDRFLQLARPIADASVSDGPELRLQDAGPFFYLVATLKRLGYKQLEQTLCILLDEFAELDERSYNELYLWCIVELSRTDRRHVDTYWPQVLALDRQRRPERWQRPEGVHLSNEPYRFTELLFYFYVLYTIRSHPQDPYDWRIGKHKGNNPTLGSHLKRLLPRLGEGEIAIARCALKDLAAAEPHRPAFGDALGMLSRYQASDGSPG
ncbi:MAG TPA: hypothetical protein VEL76_10650 [Gemmataceae bacterium]|nr:hypothetical protein [Gemmataceae bacterium]